MSDYDKRFGRRYTRDGELEIVIWQDSSGNFLDQRLGPFSASNPPSSTEFPDWPTLIGVINTPKKLIPERMSLTGPTTWTSTSDMVSFNIKALNSSSSTFTGINTPPTPIETGETISYSADQSDPNNLEDGVVLEVASGDFFIIEYQTSTI